MLALPNIADLRMQQQIAHELYRQQIMQRLPDPLCGLLPNFATHFMPAQTPLHGVEAKLENNELWQQFHSIGTEMIITKTGRRMFPSMRVSFNGLEDETNYCVLLEMVPIGDCRYKFSGSQWLPAGGAEPQSPQRMYIHPDSPATGKHWQSQPLLFSKVKLTNNTLDNNGHVVLASMHKYQPRLHIIRTSDLTQIPWAPQQAFVFPETEFIAVTAYQNDRITKLKIDHNPFAKGFRESGQSRCKRKLSDSPPPPPTNTSAARHTPSVSPPAKRLRFVEELQQPAAHFMQHNYLLDTLESNLSSAQHLYVPPMSATTIDYARHNASYPSWAYTPPSPASYAHDDCESSSSLSACSSAAPCDGDAATDTFVDVVSTNVSELELPKSKPIAAAAAPKRSSFSILDILGAAAVSV